MSGKRGSFTFRFDFADRGSRLSENGTPHFHGNRRVPGGQRKGIPRPEDPSPHPELQERLPEDGPEVCGPGSMGVVGRAGIR